MINRTGEILWCTGLILILVIFLLQSTAEAWDPDKKSAMETISGTTDNLTLTEWRQRVSYALGMVLGGQLHARSVEVDLDLYLLGLNDGLQGESTLMTPAEAQKVVQAIESGTGESALSSKGVDGLRIFFKLDPRLTRSHYMGDRWVSPPAFTSTIQMGPELVVEARVGVHGIGSPDLNTEPEWIPSDPDMVEVTPLRGRQVKIRIKRSGESGLQMVLGELTKDLHVKAIDRGGRMQVEIYQ